MASLLPVAMHLVTRMSDVVAMSDFTLVLGLVFHATIEHSER